jgi:hypothetical protein
MLSILDIVKLVVDYQTDRQTDRLTDWLKDIVIYRSGTWWSMLISVCQYVSLVITKGNNANNNNFCLEKYYSIVQISQESKEN